MSKQNRTRATILSISVLATLCLLAAVITAQKTPNTTTGVPIRGIDYQIWKNPPGTTAVRIGKTDKDGKIDLTTLAPGSYGFEIVSPATQKQATLVTAVAVDDHEDLVITITGAQGGPIEMIWDVKMKRAHKPMRAAERAAGLPVAYSDKIVFEIGPSTNPTPVFATVVKSKSNITNN